MKAVDVKSFYHSPQEGAEFVEKLTEIQKFLEEQIAPRLLGEGGSWDEVNALVDRAKTEERPAILALLSLHDIIKHITQADIQVDNGNLLAVAAIAFQLQNAKELSYGRSWCKHGDLSAFFNLERKWDRIYNIMNGVISDGIENSPHFKDTGDAESLTDTIFDLGIYALMWVGFIMEQHPEAGNAFRRGVKRFLDQSNQIHS